MRLDDDHTTSNIARQLLAFCYMLREKSYSVGLFSQ